VPLPESRWLRKRAKHLNETFDLNINEFTHISVPPLQNKAEPLLTDWRIKTLSLQGAQSLQKTYQKMAPRVVKWAQKVPEKLGAFVQQPWVQRMGGFFTDMGAGLTIVFAKTIKHANQWDEDVNPFWHFFTRAFDEVPNFKKLVIGTGATALVGYLAVILGPVLWLNTVFTQMQKDSSRIGLMRADANMKDPRFFMIDPKAPSAIDLVKEGI
jgi:hypothetical protein